MARFAYGHANMTQPIPPARLNTHALFPTTIWQVKLARFAADLPRWTQEAMAMRAASPVPAGRTNRGGWNSPDSAVLDRPAFAALGAEIRRLMAQAIAEMTGSPPEFTVQSWINMHDRGGFNFLHMHDNTLLSGVFYIAVPPGSGGLMFRDPRAGVLHSPFKGNGANACKEVRLAPSDGLLVLFPHWLEHYVEPHEGDSERVAIAFNALP
jgi:uncharacterized protein (TIGR02466 family)